MYCPHCSQSNPAYVETCTHCGQRTSSFRQHIFIGRQFVFARASDRRPLALGVDGDVKRFERPAILSRHQHAISFGDDPAKSEESSLLRRLLSRGKSESVRHPLPDQPRLPSPALKLAALVSDRKIYQPDGEATLFMVAPAAAGEDAALELQFAGQKLVETKLPLNGDGLALYTVDGLKEGEYAAIVTLPGDLQADCTFSVAAFTLSPLIATLEQHAYVEKRLSFSLKLLLLSAPYSGPAEFGLQCKVCGDQVVATQEVEVRDGVAAAEFDVSGHGGPFHIQVTTPDGNTALIAFPGTGAREREHIIANSLGQTAEIGLLPWENAEPVRGFYIGPGELDMTPLMLENVHAASGQLRAASDLAQVQILLIDPLTGDQQLLEHNELKRGDLIEFEARAPYTLFTAAAFLAGEESDPFEGWGIVIKPVPFEATLSAPKSARPGEEIDVSIEIPPPAPSNVNGSAICWLLAYDPRLEHESPIPKLAKRIYDSVRDGGSNLIARSVSSAENDPYPSPVDFMATALPASARMMRTRAPARLRRSRLGEPSPQPVVAAAPMMAQAGGVELSTFMDTVVEAPEILMTPSRMEFPELAYQELFHFSGKAARTIRLGDQIGTWRLRAYIFKGVDYQELTADVQADKSIYAELDLPAIASEGDKISATVDYNSPGQAELFIATQFGEKRVQVDGSGRERFTIHGPGRVEVVLRGETESDMSVRQVAQPGMQMVTTSQLHILDQGETVSGERVVVYPSIGQVLKETITALTDYPFG
jgi:hypothetical protein